MYARDYTSMEDEDDRAGMTSEDNVMLIRRVINTGMQGVSCASCGKVLIKYFIQRRHKLCQGIQTIKTRSVLNCEYLHYFNPYMKLGPFKYEVVNWEPFIGVLRDMHTKEEVRDIKEGAKGRMKATPLTVGNDKEKKVLAYTRRRSSKVVYQSESLRPVLEKTSQRINLATKFVLTGERMASENYQVMNYGMGGTIKVHTDVEEGLKPWDDNFLYGGQRLVTYMIYLSEVEGGRTVFTSVGVSQEPRVGDAIFWFNIRSDGGFDTRSYHTGCPVIFGNNHLNEEKRFKNNFRKQVDC